MENSNVREGVNCRIVKMSVKLRDQQIKVFYMCVCVYIYIYTIIYIYKLVCINHMTTTHKNSNK